MLLTAWVLAAVTVPLADRFVLSAPWLFPCGVVWYAVPTDWLMTDNIYVVALLAVGWVPFAALTIFCFRASRSIQYFIGYAVLCALLITDLAGMHSLATFRMLLKL